MAEIKWIKIVTDIFDDEKMLLIESLPSADSIIVIWFKLLCLAGKNNNSGVFLFNNSIPYTDEMLATIFRRDVNTVRLALKTFEEFGMVEIINGAVTIPNWDKHQSLDSYEKRKERDRIYQRERREKQKKLALGEKSTDKSSDKSTDKSSDVAPLDKDIDKDIDIDIDNSISKDILVPIKLEPIVKKWNSLGLQEVKAINPGTNRYKLLSARVKEFGIDKILETIESINKSSFLKGQNHRGWAITFDWLIKPNNFVKVMEGNYLDKEGVNNDNTRKDTGTSKIKINIPKGPELTEEDRKRAEQELI